MHDRAKKFKIPVAGPARLELASCRRALPLWGLGEYETEETGPMASRNCRKRMAPTSPTGCAVPLDDLSYDGDQHSLSREILRGLQVGEGGIL